MADQLQTAEILSLVSEIKAIPEFKAIKPTQRRFILAYSRTFNVLAAANAVGISWPNHYKWLRISEHYKQAFNYAKELAADFAEGDIYERAFVGKEIVKVKGKGEDRIVERYNDKSDILSMFMLKGMRPQYRDSYTPAGSAAPITLSISYPGSQPPTIDITPNSDKLALENKDE